VTDRELFEVICAELFTAVGDVLDTMGSDVTR
jgi:hypothetical protein